MSHTIHHTEGFIVSSFNYGEANKAISVYTKDFGMVMAMAQGIRNLASKLKYSLQDFSFIDLDLVRGKEVWRITSAKPRDDFSEIKKDKNKFEVFVRVLKFVDRLCQGEEEHQIFFDDLFEGFSYLEKSENLKEIEILMALRIIYHFGYLGNKELMKFIGSPINDSLLMEVKKNKSIIVKEVNRAITESHL